MTAPEINGVDLETVSGIRVGNAAPALEAAHPDGSSRVSVNGASERLDVFVDTIDLPESAEMPGDLTFAVWLIAPDPAGAITEFRAPSGNFGV